MISAIFKSNIASFQYMFKNGMSAVFINGRYETSNPEQVRELATEVGQVGKYKSSHPYIFVDEDEQEIDSEALTPLEIIKIAAKEEARKELLEEQAAALAAIQSAAANSPIRPEVSEAEAAQNVNTILDAPLNTFASSLNNTDKLNEDATAESGVGITNTTSATSATGLGARLANLKK